MKRIPFDEAYDRASMRVILQPLIAKELADFERANEIPHEFSREFQEKMQSLCRRERWRRRLRRSCRTCRRIAACVLLLAVMALAACAAVKPLRDMIAGAFISWYEKFSRIEFRAEEADVAPKEPTYLPIGFTEVSREESDHYLSIVYTSKDGGFIFFERMQKERKYLDSFDSELASLNTIQINGVSILYSSCTDLAADDTYYWSEDAFAYSIETNLNLDNISLFIKGILNS